MPREQDTLVQIGEDFCEDMGFNPTSNSTKPLYVANSLFRWCTGIECDLKDIHEWIVSERNPKGIRSEEIIQKYGSIICDPSLSDETVDDLKEARYYLDRLFNPDSTVFPSYPNSVLNISSKWFIRSQVKSEANIGRFLFKILNTPIDGKRSPAIELIGQALSDDTDDLSCAVKPILLRQSETERIQRTDPDKDLISDMGLIEQVIRGGFDRLAQSCDYGHNGNDSLLTLRRMVNFAMFATFYYLEDINRVCYGGQRVPLLLDAGGRLAAIESASESCFAACKKAVESYTISFVKDWLLKAQVIADPLSKDSCLQYISDGFALTGVNEEKGIREIIQQHIRSNCNAGDVPLLATAKALQFALYTYRYPNNTPSDFCNVLGTKAGLVNPTKSKRFLIDRFLLETLVLSVVDANQLATGIELQELGGLLRDNYNIIIGADVDYDYSILEQYGIAGATPENLRGELSDNAKILADMLISMGIARRYADGVTIIGWGV